PASPAGAARRRSASPPSGGPTSCPSAAAGRISAAAGAAGWAGTVALDRPCPSPYKTPASRTPRSGPAAAQVAQLVEHVTENHGVGGSIPPLGTSICVPTSRSLQKGLRPGAFGRAVWKASRGRGSMTPEDFTAKVQELRTIIADQATELEEN